VISNESVQRLIETDRDTLIALMAAAYAAGSPHLERWDVYQDADIRALLEAAKVANFMPATVQHGEMWMLRAPPDRTS
jgi:hypothetical protein